MKRTGSFVKLCCDNEITAAHLYKLWVVDRSVIATRDSFGTLFVFAAECPHAQKTLQQAEWNPSEAILTCRFHWAQFDLRHNGRCIAGAECESLRLYTTRLEVESGKTWILVDLHSTQT